MFSINRTHARAVFKDLLGQANHFLITILVGLNGVRDGEIHLNEEFSTSWNPQNVKRSADRSRSFALDLALIRAIDSLDTYMMRLRRRPLAIGDPSFLSAMDGTGQKISKRLSVFNTHLKPLASHDLIFLRLSIDWRNRRVHSLAEETIEERDLEILLQSQSMFSDRFSGLDLKRVIADYKAGVAPTFKDAAAIIRMSHLCVEHFDSCILERLNVELYLKECLLMVLSGHSGKIQRDKIVSACNSIWGSEGKKEAKIMRSLRFAGLSEVSTSAGREVPVDIIDNLLRLDAKRAISYLLVS